MARPSLIVVGAGVAGLSAAWRARQHGADVRVLEASGRAGGVVETVHDGDWTADLGPNSAAERPALASLLREMNLTDERIEARSGTRYVVQGGRPVALPSSPPGLLSTPLLSPRAKLRLLTEPLRRRTQGDDPTLAAFAARRLGPEAGDALVDPFVAGVYAGDPERLSARWAFPSLWRLEREHGSLLRGALRSRSPRPPSISFRRGMQTLPKALAASLGDALRVHCPVASIRPDGSGWHVALADGQTEEAEFVILAVPVGRVAALFTDAPALRVLDAVTSPPVAVHALGFRRSDVAHPLDGVGVLVPSRERLPILGALFSSSMFPDRAPEEHVLLTVFVGGTRQPDLAQRPEADREAVLLKSLRRLLGMTADPVWRHARLWPTAIPQPEIGHGRVLDAIDGVERSHSGLAFAGSYRGGVALADALASGRDAADRLFA